MATSDVIDSATQEARAADLAARIRAELERVLMPGVKLSTEDVSAGLARFLASTPGISIEPDIKLTVDPNDPNVYHFNYTMQTAIVPQYKLTLHRPDGSSDAEWAQMCADLQAAADEVNKEAEGE